MTRTPLAALMIASLTVGGCGGGDTPEDDDGSSGTPPECTADVDCAGNADATTCDPATSKCVAALAGQIGRGDGTSASVAFVQVWVPDKLRQPTDLGFNPSKPTELWVVNFSDDSAIIIQNVGAAEMTWERRHDPAAEHFMKQPPAIAFGAVLPEWGQTFGVCGDDDQGGSSPEDFIGPALFTANLDIFAKQTPGGLGSHLDMLHSTSFCRGIAHVAENAYFAFNAQKGALDRYDFKVDHGPGNDDHSDGEILRYAEGAVKGVDGAVSHVFYDAPTGQLYIADTGNARIAKLDTATGTMGSSFGGFESLPVRNRMDGAVITDVVPAGTLQQPSGIELHDGYIFVTDTATSQFHAFDMSGKLVRSLATGLPPGSLGGFTFGPDDGKVYFVDRLNSIVWRIDPL
jgi:hypothetical protein